MYIVLIFDETSAVAKINNGYRKSEIYKINKEASLLKQMLLRPIILFIFFFYIKKKEMVNIFYMKMRSFSKKRFGYIYKKIIKIFGTILTFLIS